MKINQSSSPWVKLAINPTIQSQGYQHFIIVIEDQQPIKEAEQALKIQEQRWQTALSSAPMGIWEWQLEENKIIWSDNLEKLFGLPKGGFDGTHQCFLKTLHPDDHCLVSQAIQDSLERQKPYNVEFRVLLPNGKIRWALSQAQVYYDPITNKPVKIMGIDLDITERKESERNLRQKVKELEQRNQDIAVLNQINDFLQACQHPEESYAILGELIPLLFPQSSGALFRLHSLNYQLKAVTTWGESLDTELEFTWQDCWSLRRSNPYLMPQNKPGLLCNHITTRSCSETVSLCIPLMAQGENLGLFYISSTPDELTIPRQQLARTVSEQIALALSNLNLRNKLAEETIRDPLTNLFNRRYLGETLVREIDRAKRRQSSIGLVIIDVDNFKNFNDSFGHQEGDLILQRLARCLQSNVRGSDLVCRYGGEEILIVFPDTSLQETYQRAESIRERVKQLTAIPYLDPSVCLTISLGISAFPDHGSTMTPLIKAADDALYQAKKRGKDQTIIAEVS